ncbi:hypothetical protein V8D89_006989 [Ganoderma adspersum]
MRAAPVFSNRRKSAAPASRRRAPLSSPRKHPRRLHVKQQPPGESLAPAAVRLPSPPPRRYTSPWPDSDALDPSAHPHLQPPRKPTLPNANVDGRAGPLLLPRHLNAGWRTLPVCMYRQVSFALPASRNQPRQCAPAISPPEQAENTQTMESLSRKAERRPKCRTWRPVALAHLHVRERPGDKFRKGGEATQPPLTVFRRRSAERPNARYAAAR